MKIVNMTDQYWPTISGVSVSIDAFRHELIKKGHTVFIFAPDHPGASDLDKKMKTTNIRRFKSHTISFAQGNRIINTSEKKNIIKQLDEIKPDIIHVQTEFTMGIIGIKYAHKHKIPLVIAAHTNWEDLIALYVPFIPQRIAKIYARIRLKKFFNNADVIIAPTSLMDTLLHLYYVTKPVRVIPTGIICNPPKNIPDKSLLKKNSPALKEFPELKNKRILFFHYQMNKSLNCTKNQISRSNHYQIGFRK